jgi:hypothetical protein
VIRVVVVDDEELVRIGFRLILQAAGDIEVVATPAGAQAVREISLTVTVTNTPPTRPQLALPSARHGLIGLQERATLLDGQIHTGPTSDGGFQLQLRLPLTTAGATRG